MNQSVQYRRFAQAVKGIALGALPLTLGLLLALSCLPAAGAERGGSVRLSSLDAVVARLAKERVAARSADPNALRTTVRLEDELDGLKRRYAQARTEGREPERAALEQELTRKAAELQAAYAQGFSAMVEQNRLRSRDVRLLEIGNWVAAYGREAGLSLIVDQETGKELFRREGWSGLPSDLTLDDLTDPLTAWLQERLAAPGRPAP